MFNCKSKQAFSFVEISLVLVIVAVITVGITLGERLIDLSRIKSAQSLTLSAPVIPIGGEDKSLILWLETSRPESIIKDSSNNVRKWVDRSPKKDNHAIQATAANQPKFIKEGLNNLPTIRFDGTNDHMSIDLSRLAGSEYSFFVVEGRNAATSSNMFLGTETYGTNYGINFGYLSDTVMRFGQFANDVDLAIPAFSFQKFYIHSFILNSTGHFLYRSDGSNASNINTTAFIKLQDVHIARYANINYYSGDIAEIIVYKKALTDAERTQIETYLAKKYKIKLSS